MKIELFVSALNLVVFGAHVLLPFRLARAEELRRRQWALAAPAALLAALVATALALGRQPDAAIAWGLTDPIRGSMAAQLIAVALTGLGVADLFLFVAWKRLEPLAWRLLGAMGLCGALAYSLGAELVRIGWGPWTDRAALFASMALRLLLALAAAEAVLVRPRLWCPVAAPALLLLLWLWPAAIRHALGGFLATAFAAALLLLLARFAPPSLRRLAAIAGLVLALLVIGRAGEISQVLGTHESAHEFALEP